MEKVVEERGGRREVRVGADEEEGAQGGGEKSEEELQGGAWGEKNPVVVSSSSSASSANERAGGRVTAIRPRRLPSLSFCVSGRVSITETLSSPVGPLVPVKSSYLSFLAFCRLENDEPGQYFQRNRCLCYRRRPASS